MKRFWRKNEGFTLVELLVVITVGSLVSFAATSILLFAMRFNRVNLDTIEHQSVLRIMLNVVESLSSDEGYSIDVDADSINRESSPIISYANNQIVTGNSENPSGVLMKDVEAFDIKKPSVLELYTNAAEDLYTFSIKLDGQYFDSTIYARTKSVKIADANYYYSVFPLNHQNDWEADDPDMDYEVGREYLVNIAASQIGSNGYIMDYPSGVEGKHYTLWYHNTTSFPSGWTAKTPWCAVFASWVLNETNNGQDENNNPTVYLNTVPKEANVNLLWTRCFVQMGANHLKINIHDEDNGIYHTPQPGDLIFFEFNNDEEDINGTEDLSGLRNLENYDDNLRPIADLAIDWEKMASYVSKVIHNDPTLSISEKIINPKYILDPENDEDAWELENRYPRVSYEHYEVVKHFFGCVGKGLNHVGVVAKVEDGIIYTIEGNSETIRISVNDTEIVNQVVLRKYDLKDSRIFGYAELDWNPAYK